MLMVVWISMLLKYIRWMWYVLTRSCWKCTFRWSITVGIHLTNFTCLAFERLREIKISMIFTVSCWTLTTFITLSMKHHLLFWLKWFFNILGCFPIFVIIFFFIFVAFFNLNWIGWSSNWVRELAGVFGEDSF